MPIISEMQQDSTIGHAQPDHSDFCIPNKKSQQEVSVLPLESLRLPRAPHRPFLDGTDQKYLHLNKSKSPTPSRLASAKQLVFRASGQRWASEEKAQQLQETRMLARERRLHRAQLEMKTAGFVSPRVREQQRFDQEQQLKKFRRSEERRLLAETKKFKRIKEKPDAQQLAIRDKIMKKLMDAPQHFLSGIAENSEELCVSRLSVQEIKGVSLFQQSISETEEVTQQSQIALQ